MGIRHHKAKALVVLMGFFITMISFQNCSVYKSDGKKWVEKNGINISTANQMISEQSSNPRTDKSGEMATRQAGCEPFVSLDQTQSLLGQSATASSYYDDALAATVCVFTTDLESPVDALVCTLSQKNLGLLSPQEDEDTFTLSDAPPHSRALGKMGATGYHVYAAVPGPNWQEAWACQMHFGSAEEFATYQTQALDRLSRFLSTFARQ